MDEGFDAKELLVRHLSATKEIESREEFNSVARKRFYVNERGELTKRGIILATVVQSDPNLLSPH